MKRIRHIIKKGTDLIPIEFNRFRYPIVYLDQTYLFLKRHPLIFKICYLLKTNKMFSWLVLIPWLLAAFYIFSWQTPSFQSSARILIEREEKDPVNISMGILNNNQANISDIYLTKEHILSREVLNHVQNKLNIKAHFQAKAVDFFSRLETAPSDNAFLTYYRKKVGTAINDETNEIIITASAFSAKTAQELLRAVIQETKEFVNRVSNTLAKKQYVFTKMKLHLAKQKLFQASKDVIEWQNQNGMFDPKETAQVVSAVMAKLKGNLVEKQTELITYSSFMQPSANKIITLEEEIKALKEQIEQQTNILLGKKAKRDKLNKIVSDFEWVQLQLKFAQAEYQAAQQAFDAAAINLAKNQNIVIEVEKPNTPDEPSEPVPFYNLSNLFFILLVFFLLIRMAIVIIKEHRD